MGVERRMNSKERKRTMLDIYLGGETLEEVGNRFDITKERVRQVISEFPEYYKREKRYNLTEKSLSQRRKNAQLQHERKIPFGGRPREFIG